MNPKLAMIQVRRIAQIFSRDHFERLSGYEIESVGCDLSKIARQQDKGETKRQSLRSDMP